MTPDPATEIDILAVVVHCGPPKYAGRGPNKCREITVTDNQKKRLLLTLWEDFSEVEGTIIQKKIEPKMNDDERYPVILRRSIGISTYDGLSLQTRFNSTIQIHPAYP
ncbi:replication protein A 70 kDa DNA-binding subunit B-like [Nicotiana sylvestris]|uniref:replication protein A 70 kDa DNA-binding subunit B-like n=1 Tax=Nicotiana sylvestris TaxID=4096 RepID=UPI00388CDD65